MQTAQFKSLLVDNIERNYQTATNPQDLLSSKNLTLLGDYTKHGTGTYIDTFIDDMAVTRTVVTIEIDDDGRPFPNLDVAVIKFDKNDKQLLLDLLKEKFLHVLEQAQNRNDLTHPLREIKV